MGTTPHPREGTLLSMVYLLAWPHLQVFTQAVPLAWKASSRTLMSKILPIFRGSVQVLSYFQTYHSKQSSPSLQVSHCPLEPSPRAHSPPASAWR